MQDASSNSNSVSAAPARRNHGAILVGGTLIVLVAAGVSMQVWRARSSNAAEQKAAAKPDVQAREDALQQPVGRVNGKVITYEQLARECFDRHGKEVLENLINRTIIQQACAEQGVSVSEAEVNQEIIELSKKFGLAVDQYYQLLESERGLTPTQYRSDVVWPMLAMKKLAGGDVKITREMMTQAYEDSYGERVKARMIVFDNLRHAQEAWEKLRTEPENFERFARELSVEPNSRALGGTIPPIRRHSGAHEEIRKVAFGLTNPGDISGIIQVDVSQYVILRYEGRTEPVEHDYKDVEAQLQQELTEREVARMVGETFEKIQKSAKVDNLLTGESRGYTTASTAELPEPSKTTRK